MREDEHGRQEASEPEGPVPPWMSSPSATAEPALIPAQLTQVASAVTELTEQVREHHVRAAARERIIEKLHAEVEQLRAGERTLVLRPVVTDLQNLRGDLLHQARVLPAEIDRQQVVELLWSFALSAEQALERCGSVPIRPEIGAEFSTREHRAVKIVPAEREDQHERIAAVVADGYRDTMADRVALPARVHVYRWTAGSTAKGNGIDG